MSNHYELSANKLNKVFLQTLVKTPFILRGHRPYGIHKVIIPPADYITMLAPPVERCISDYFFTKQSKYPVYEHPQWENTNRYSIIECLEKNIIKDNALVRAISGVKKKQLNKMDLNLAMYNLENKYLAFGLKTAFNASCEYIASSIGVNFNIPKKAHKKTNKEKLSSFEQNQLIKYHKYDIAFYKYAEELFYNRTSQ